MVFPLGQLFILFIKQASKPIANSVKTRAKSSGFFKRVCSGFAQGYHRMEISWRRKGLGLSSAEKIQPLKEETAIMLGAELLGEVVVYSIATSIFLFEWSRRYANEEIKEEKRKQELDAIISRISELELQTEAQEAKLRNYERHIYDLQDKNQSITTKLFGGGKKLQS
ncbi:hypothetical protein KUTeg_014015 [Tegillarca granosa]|uniref:OPA3-like protein n=1 Tax=Tegillarca granosa TaxID=220873 RepID=A0ABQ9EVC6_TEGGR|nr:hypothetical protein KUTeg_014015 [Tegillarca granosa]